MVTPSTSLAGAIASNAARSSICSGTGCCSRIPCTVGSFESLVSSATSSSVVVSAGSTTLTEPMPAFLLRFCFIRTYVAEAGSSPTRTVARHGCTPVSSCSFLARTAACATMSAARSVPIIGLAVLEVSVAFEVSGVVMRRAPSGVGESPSLPRRAAAAGPAWLRRAVPRW
jgi:hypothetical protein